MSVVPDVPAELDALRAELQQLRRERDALAGRVSALEQQLAEPRAGEEEAAASSFEDGFRSEQARAKRQRAPLSMALVELDALQDVRDRLGHAAGEEALAHLGALLAQGLRPTDVVARVDGLSHGVLLSATNVEQAVAAMTRLQETVAASPLDTGHAQHVLNFSAGVVQWRMDETLADLLTRASRALGLARRGGSGKIVVG